MEDVGNDFNSVISLTYGHIRNFDFPQIGSEVDKQRGVLFTKRFSVRIKSEVFLRSEDFWRKYDKLTFEIDKIVKLLCSLSKGYDSERVIEKIEHHRSAFAADWPFQDRREHSKYPPPCNHLVMWADMVFDRSVWLLTTNLDDVVETGRRRHAHALAGSDDRTVTIAEAVPRNGEVSKSS